MADAVRPAKAAGPFRIGAFGDNMGYRHFRRALKLPREADLSLMSTGASALNPAWVAATSAAIGGIIALRIVIHWCMIRRVFRGSGGAIIALLGESECEVMRPTSQSATGRISSQSEIAYFKVGADRYMLCVRDLDRLRREGYISLVDSKYQLSRLGRLLLEKYDNGRLLAKSVARARRTERLRCPGGHYLRCRCARYRYWVAGRQVPVPFFLGKRLEVRECTR